MSVAISHEIPLIMDVLSSPSLPLHGAGAGSLPGARQAGAGEKGKTSDDPSGALALDRTSLWFQYCPAGYQCLEPQGSALESWATFVGEDAVHRINDRLAMQNRLEPFYVELLHGGEPVCQPVKAYWADDNGPGSGIWIRATPTSHVILRLIGRISLAFSPSYYRKSKPFEHIAVPGIGAFVPNPRLRNQFLTRDSIRPARIDPLRIVNGT